MILVGIYLYRKRNIFLVQTYTLTCVCVCVCILYVNVCTCVYICVRVYMCVCIYIYFIKIAKLKPSDTLESLDMTQNDFESQFFSCSLIRHLDIINVTTGTTV